MSAMNKKRIIFLSLLLLLLYFSQNALAINKIPYVNFRRRISMDFKDASLKDVLKIFSQQAGLNFVASADIEDVNLTLYLDNVTVQQALDKLLSANNLVYDLETESNIFVVKRSTLPEVITISKVFYLKYARVPGSRLGQEISSGAAEGGISLTAGGGGGGEGEESVIVEVIGKVLTEHGKVDADPRTNSLIITEIPERFEVIEEIIAKLDVPLPQVMIEVEMLDVSKVDSDLLGIQWPEAIAQLDITGQRQTAFPFTGKHKPKTSGTWTDTVTSPGEVGLGSPTVKDFTPNIFKLINTNLALNFLKTRSETKILARPRILTLSGETAEIKIVTDEAIGLEETETSTSEGGSTTSVGAERTETGVSLRVTPQVDVASNEITMFIQPIVAETKTGGTFGTGDSAQTFLDPERRTTKATVRIKNGETLMIGGLIRTKTTDVRNKVPFFSKIPLLGMLFRHKDKDVSERELIVFITPHILPDNRIGAGLARSFDSSRLTLDLDREQVLSSRELEIESLLKQYEIR